MIVPNLMVSDMARSVRFYRDILGMTLTMTVSPEREVGWPGEASEAAFAVLEWDGAQLMLQTVESLAGELAVFAPDHAPAPSGTIYFRGLHPESVRDRVAAEDIVKGPERSWYGMMELYVRDPDGYVICIGAPEGDRRRECGARRGVGNGRLDPETAATLMGVTLHTVQDRRQWWEAAGGINRERKDLEPRQTRGACYTRVPKTRSRVAWTTRLRVSQYPFRQ